MMREIVQVHFPNISQDLLEASVNTFYRLRGFNEVEKTCYKGTDKLGTGTPCRP